MFDLSKKIISAKKTNFASNQSYLLIHLDIKPFGSCTAEPLLGPAVRLAVSSRTWHGEVIAPIVPGQLAGVHKVQSVVASLAPIVEEISRQRQNLEIGNPSVVIM